MPSHLTLTYHTRSSFIFIPSTSQSKIQSREKKTMSPQTENTQTPVPMVDTKYCTRKRSKESKFVDNAKENINSFFHASLDEHMACFKATWHKMTGKFQRKYEGLEDAQTKN